MAAKNNEITLNVNTGYKTVKIRDGDEIIGEFKFNPTDSNIVERMGCVVEFFNSVDFSDEVTAEQAYDRAKKLCKDICDQFNFLFGRNVSDGIFASCGPLSVTENGDFYFEDILDKIGDIIEQTAGERVERKLARIRKAAGEYADAPALAPLT